MQQYGQWYCTRCQQYQQPGYQQGYPQQPYPPAGPPPAEESKGKIVIIIVVVVVIVVFLAIIGMAVFYVWSMNLSDTGEEAARFPTIEITLKDSPTGDSLSIKHLAGDELDWSDYKMIISNQSDPIDTATMNSLSGRINAGQQTTFTTEGTAGFSSINYQKAKAYQIEIFEIDMNRLVWQKKNVICE
jgi:hypothetical protein